MSRGLQALKEGNIDAFVTAAAIENIAWNCTIAEQVGSPLFQRNLRQLVEDVGYMFARAADTKGLELVCAVPYDAPVAVRGDPEHPANRGRLCSKGSTLHLKGFALPMPSYILATP